MDVSQIIKSTLFLLILLNPFLVIVYLIDIMKKLPFQKFRNVLVRAGIISALVFIAFAILGDIIFNTVIQANFASFQIFGGVVFLLIGLQFIFRGGAAIQGLRGESKHIAGSIAMPILIGPGTINFSIIIGEQLNKPQAAIAIFLAVALSIGIMILLKKIHDNIASKKEDLLQRYYEVSGKITALIVGTISIEMIMNGLKFWINN